MKVLADKLSSLTIREEARPDPEALKKALITFVATAAMMVFAIGLMALLQSQYPDMPFQALGGVGVGGSVGMMVAGFTVVSFILGLYLYNTCRKKEERKVDVTPLAKPTPKVANVPPPPAITFPDADFEREYRRVEQLVALPPVSLPSKGNVYHSFEVGNQTKVILWKDGKAQPKFQSYPLESMIGSRGILETEGYTILHIPSSSIGTLK